jgi:GNAT superfamily N-acetyltransferase
MSDSTINPIPNAHLAATEYAQFGHPEYTQRVPFGYFVRIPQFPDRSDANQVFDVRCHENTSDVELCEPFVRHGIRRAKLTGHDDDTLASLRERGTWQLGYEWMLLHQKASQLQGHPDVRLEVSVPGSSREDEICALSPSLRRHPYHRFNDARLGGKLVFAWLANTPVASTGWCVVNGVARFRYVQTLPQHRGQGIATAMIHFVQQHIRKDGSRGLVIFCDDERTIGLYEKLGFVRNGFYWKAARELSP